MGRIVVILFLLATPFWAATTWLEMRKSRGPRERAWVARASFALWLGSLISTAAFALFAVRGQLFAIPVFIVAGISVLAGLRRVRARIREQESDPLSRAKRIN